VHSASVLPLGAGGRASGSLLALVGYSKLMKAATATANVTAA
jgi:hypothetical protein